jgi:hypothetical protein
MADKADEFCGDLNDSSPQLLLTHRSFLPELAGEYSVYGHEVNVYSLCAN